MSTGSKFFDWCRIPPEPPKDRHKKLLATSLICTILSVSLFTSLAVLNGGFMAGQTSALISGTVLSVANLAEGPNYIQNATYQNTAEANNSTVQNYEGMMRLIQDNVIGVLFFGGGGGYSSDDSGGTSSTIINFGDQDLTVTSIEIYQGNTLFAVIDGPFTVKAHTIGTVNIQIYNRTELSKWETQQLTQNNGKERNNNETTCNWPYDWRPVVYTAMVTTSEGLTATFQTFTFPTAPNPDFLYDSDGNFLGWPVKAPNQRDNA